MRHLDTITAHFPLTWCMPTAQHSMNFFSSVKSMPLGGISGCFPLQSQVWLQQCVAISGDGSGLFFFFLSMPDWTMDSQE
jgi:hypothetical protein